MFHTVGFVLTAKNSTPENVGRNMGNFTAIGEIGRVSLPPLALLATSLIGWRMTIGITGTIGIFIFLVAQFFTPPKNTHVLAEENKSSQNHKEFITDIALVFRNKHAAGITLTAIIDTFASSPLNVYLPFLLLAKGMTPAQMGLAMAVFFIGSLLGKWLLGLSVDRLGNRKVFIISEFCMALALLFISQSTEHMLLFLFALILGIFAKGTSPVVQTLFSTLTEKDHYHKVFAFSELVIQLSAAFTITLFGAIADKTGIAIVFYISALLAIIATIPIFSVSKIKNNAVPNVF